MTISDAFVKQLQDDYDAYIKNDNAIKYIFYTYRLKIDEISKCDFTQFFTISRLENEDACEYLKGLNTYQDNLFDYIHMLQEHDFSFLETDYHDEKIDHFFGTPMILATTLREHLERFKDIFTPDEFIIVNAIAEINLRYNRLEETIIQLKGLDSYTSLWAQDNILESNGREDADEDGELQMPPMPSDDEHVRTLPTQ